MTENTFRINRETQPEPGAPAKGWSLFSGLERRLQFEKYFEAGFPVRYLPRALFVFALGLVYIGNSHYAEQTVRLIDRTHSEVEDLRADFTTQKAELMYASKQSEVASKVVGLGFQENVLPPIKVEVDPDQY